MTEEENSEMDPAAEALMKQALESVERITEERKGQEEGGAPAEEGAAPAGEAAKPAAAGPSEIERLRGTLERVDGVRKELQEKWLKSAAELEKLNGQVKDLNDKYLRSVADFDNFRKRVQRERSDLAKYGGEQLARQIVSVVDNFERAIGAAGDPAKLDPTFARFVEGIRMTRLQFLQALASAGVQPFESVGRPFDPAVHQAMSQTATAEAAPNTVLSEMQRGYMIHDRLLRPAMVVVARAPEESGGAEGAPAAPNGSGEEPPAGQ
ncbi:MAG: nucleotide exchange factor GrpE [Bdellovibrionota bacterium]